MRASPLPDLAPVSRGSGFLRRHPLQTFGLALLTLLLSFLGPALQVWAGVPDDPLVSMILALAALIPLELYFMPRFLLELDAETLDLPQNPRDGWRATFETRWLAASVSKALLYLAVGAGATLLLFPGIILLVVFGWTPWRVLLRGESILVAARSSASLMARHWVRLLPPFSAILTVQFLALLGAYWLESHAAPDPVTPWIRLTHPVLWAIDFGGGLLNVWISATCLAVYHRLEELSLAPKPESS